MAIQFNANALSWFANVNFGNDNAIANLGDNDGLVQKKENNNEIVENNNAGERLNG